IRVIISTSDKALLFWLMIDKANYSSKDIYGLKNQFKFLIHYFSLVLPPVHHLPPSIQSYLLQHDTQMHLSFQLDCRHLYAEMMSRRQQTKSPYPTPESTCLLLRFQGHPP